MQIAVANIESKEEHYTKIGNIKKAPINGCLDIRSSSLLFQMLGKVLSHIKHRNLAFTCKN